MWSILFALTFRPELSLVIVRVPVSVFLILFAADGVKHPRHLRYSLHTVRDGYVTVGAEPAGGPPISRYYHENTIRQIPHTRDSPNSQPLATLENGES